MDFQAAMDLHKQGKVDAAEAMYRSMIEVGRECGSCGPWTRGRPFRFT
jgi:pentatricopeptide repeat protein